MARVAHVLRQVCDVVRQRRCRNTERLLELADCKTAGTRAHQRPEDAQTGLIAEAFERCGRLLQFHRHISIYLEITKYFLVFDYISNTIEI